MEQVVTERRNNMSADFEDIKLVEIITEKITEPTGEGRGGALYAIPIKLSGPVPSQWAAYFAYAWDHPGKFTSMHRPGIARVVGNTIILDGTTMQELEEVHLPTLKGAVAVANKQYREYLEQKERGAKEAEKKSAAHRQEVEEMAKRIKFD